MGYTFDYKLLNLTAQLLANKVLNKGRLPMFFRHREERSNVAICHLSQDCAGLRSTPPAEPDAGSPSTAPRLWRPTPFETDGLH